MAEYKRQIVFSVSVAILLALIAGGAAVYFFPNSSVQTSGPSQSVNSNTSQGNQLAGITGLPLKPDFRIEGSKMTSFTVAPGENVTGEVTLQILNPQPIGVFLNDYINPRCNCSSILPEGISVVVSSGNITFTLERLSSIGSETNGKSPLVPTFGLTTVSFTFIIHVNKTVAAGTYPVILEFVTFRQNQTEIYSGSDFTVELTVS